jgi:hypothetical protein
MFRWKGKQNSAASFVALALSKVRSARFLDIYSRQRVHLLIRAAGYPRSSYFFYHDPDHITE